MEELESFGGEFVGLEIFSFEKQDWILLGLGMLSGLMQFYMIDNCLGSSLRIVKYDLDAMEKEKALELIGKARDKMRQQASKSDYIADPEKEV